MDRPPGCDHGARRNTTFRPTSSSRRDSPDRPSVTAERTKDAVIDRVRASRYRLELWTVVDDDDWWYAEQHGSLVVIRRSSQPGQSSQ